MAKLINVVRAHIKKPPLEKVIIALTRDEAQLVRDLLGATTGDVGSGLFDTLIGIEELNTPYRIFKTIDIEAATPVAPTGSES